MKWTARTVIAVLAIALAFFIVDGNWFMAVLAVTAIHILERWTKRWPYNRTEVMR